MNTYKNMNRKEKGLVLKGMLSLAALMVCSLSFYSCSDDLAEVTADDNTSETEVTDLRDIIKIDATHSIDATVDESASCCVCEFGQR